MLAVFGERTTISADEEDGGVYLIAHQVHVGHVHAFSRPCGTCAIVKSPYPTLKGWAILETSLRDAPDGASDTGTMVVRTDAGHMYAFSRPCGTCAIVKSPYPTLKGWAILETSLRDVSEILMALPGTGALLPNTKATAKMTLLTELQTLVQWWYELTQDICTHSAVPAGLLCNREIAIPNLERLGYSRNIPPGCERNPDGIARYGRPPPQCQSGVALRLPPHSTSLERDFIGRRGSRPYRRLTVVRFLNRMFGKSVRQMAHPL